jgi:hypothetical protein
LLYFRIRIRKRIFFFPLPLYNHIYACISDYKGRLCPFGNIFAETSNMDSGWKASLPCKDKLLISNMQTAEGWLGRLRTWDRLLIKEMDRWLVPD